MSSILSVAELRRALSIRDLTDPAEGPHALQLIIEAILRAVAETLAVRVSLQRKSPIVSVADNYDRLRYPSDGLARSARYTRYVCETALLRTHTSAMIPELLRDLAHTECDDILLACPGLVYRRDCIDRLHTGEPHQMDLWRVRRDPKLNERDLLALIECIVGAVLPNCRLRTSPADHPYTQQGLQIDVEHAGTWIEIGECGLAAPQVLRDAGLPETVSGLAVGLGLDRILMLRKGIDDVRLLRSTHPQVMAQMRDLTPYKPVSCMPSVQRDLSIVRQKPTSAEDLGDLIRRALGTRAELIQSVAIVNDSAAQDLPAHVVQRLGLLPGQRNLLVRLVLLRARAQFDAH